MSIRPWDARLREAGIEVHPLGPGHWRTERALRTVDYWPSTGRWRDNALGLQGVGINELLRHYRKYEQKGPTK